MRAETYPQFVILIIIQVGISNPLYQVGADAMLADMIPSEKRTDAYAISRIANNAAFALGPAVGGFLAATSYNLAFYGAATGYLIYSLLLFFLRVRRWKNSKRRPTKWKAGRLKVRVDTQMFFETRDLCYSYP